MSYNIFKIFSVSKTDKKLFFEAFFNSLIVRISLLFTPFNKYSKKIGNLNSEIKTNNLYSIETINAISLAVKRAAKYSLWRNKCLEQAITAKKMLKKRNIDSTIYFGVCKNNSKLEAHAWLKINEVFVVGERNHKKFTVVAWYS